MKLESVRSVSAPLQDNLARHQITKCCRNNSGMLEREVIGSLLFLAGANEWVRKKEIRHILGFVAHSAEWSFILKSAEEDWEELRLSTFCDASFGTRCFGNTSQVDRAKRQFLLVNKSPKKDRTAEHEFN